MEEILKQALQNEYDEAKSIVNHKLDEGDKNCFYKMYTIGKILMKYLEQKIQEGDKFAKNINDHLEKMAEYYNKEAK